MTTRLAGYQSTTNLRIIKNQGLNTCKMAIVRQKTEFDKFIATNGRYIKTQRQPSS